MYISIMGLKVIRILYSVLSYGHIHKYAISLGFVVLKSTCLRLGEKQEFKFKILLYQISYGGFKAVLYIHPFDHTVLIGALRPSLHYS